MAVPSKPASPSILERFRELLKEREGYVPLAASANAIGNGGGDVDGFVVPPSTTDEIVRLYEMVLSELTSNSKSIITDLTIIAGEQREHGDGIADAVCARILEAPVDQKLPALYLLDSIVKSMGREYVRFFSSHLPQVFCETYRQVQSNLYPSMHHLFGTWSKVFPSSVLRKIEAELQFLPSSSLANKRASESPRPTHGIHVNPKYLEARRQFDNSSVHANTQQARGSSTFKLYEQKSATRHDDHDAGLGEAATDQVGAQRLAGYGGSTSFSLRAEKLSPSIVGPTRPSSPSMDEFAMSNSPGHFADRASPSGAGVNFGLGRILTRDEQAGDWRKTSCGFNDGHRGIENVPGYSPSNSHRGFENVPGYSPSIDHGLDRPRALIDAYGHDDGQRISNERPLNVDPRHMVNGMDGRIAKPWQNTEEEEFDWDHIDHRNNDPLSFGTRTFRTRPGLAIHSKTSSDSSLRGWPTQALMSGSNDSASIAEDTVSSRGVGYQPFSKLPDQRVKVALFVNSHHPHMSRNMVPNVPESSRNHLPVSGIKRSVQLTLSGTGLSSSVDKTTPHSDYLCDADSQLGRLSNIKSRADSTGYDSARPPAVVLPVLAGLRPCMSLYTSQLPHPPVYPLKQMTSRFDFLDTANRALNQVSKPYSAHETKCTISARPPEMTTLQAGQAHLSHQVQPPVSFQQQMLSSTQSLQRSALSSLASLPPDATMMPASHRFDMLGNIPATSNTYVNPISSLRPAVPFQNVQCGPLHAIQPLPLGPPALSQIISHPRTTASLPNPPSGTAFLGLINSLVAQGLISLTKQTPEQDSLGTEFNLDLVKAHHESAIRSLYADLPRQCTTCGLRFKTQEEHSKHMDWHATKNRISRNRKQNPSRRWFVNTTMWLSGAETLGIDAAPRLLPKEPAVERKVDKEVAVFADEDQKTCALCGDSFEDFYSEETEDWMYKEAVYLNAPDGSIGDVDRSQLGPIVHAKCRSDSSAAPLEDLDQEREGNPEDGSTRKRMRR